MMVFELKLKLKLIVLKYIKRPIGVIITKVIKETGIGYGYTLYLNRKPL